VALAFLVERDFLGGVTIVVDASADEEDDELMGIGVVFVEERDNLFLLFRKLNLFVLTVFVALIDGDFGVIFLGVVVFGGKFIFIGSTFIGGNCND
jgi:hypothetical protein